MAEKDALNPGKRIDGHWVSRSDGLWTTCITQANFLTQCKGYDSMVSLTPDLKLGRILMSFAIGFSIIAFVIAVVSMLLKRWFCDAKAAGKCCLRLTAGISYFLAGIFVFIPVTWTAANIMRHVCSPMCSDLQRLEMGEALFLGWLTAVLLFIAGSMMCWFCPCAATDAKVHYKPPSFQSPQEYELRPMKKQEYSTHLIHEHL
ncbi:claudin-17-like [Ambystoma mexicanum]|uniref:claudin-17-like n=1 Tax=Ambystoma mexicanum TaxID=8296 RepID=UPI0037E9C48A